MRTVRSIYLSSNSIFPLYLFASHVCPPDDSRARLFPDGSRTHSRQYLGDLRLHLYGFTTARAWGIFIPLPFTLPPSLSTVVWSKEREHGNRVSGAPWSCHPLEFPRPCANSLYRRDRRGKVSRPFATAGTPPYVHLFHAPRNIGTLTRKHSFSFLTFFLSLSHSLSEARKDRGEPARNILRCTNRDNSRGDVRERRDIRSTRGSASGETGIYYTFVTDQQRVETD